jgi:hypothetical protein
VLVEAGSLVAWGLAAWALGEKGRADEESGLAQQRLEDVTREQERTKKQLGVARANLFYAQLVRVAALDERDPVGALELLHDCDACPIDLRDTNWRYHERAASRWLHLTFHGHTKKFASVVGSPDGRTVATVGADGTIKLWEASTGRERATLDARVRGLHGGWFSLVFSPDGKTLTVADRLQGGTARLWDAATGQLRAAVKGHAKAVHSVTVSPDGKSVAMKGEEVRPSLTRMRCSQASQAGAPSAAGERLASITWVLKGQACRPRAPWTWSRGNQEAPGPCPHLGPGRLGRRDAPAPISHLPRLN